MTPIQEAFVLGLLAGLAPLVFGALLGMARARAEADAALEATQGAAREHAA